MKKSNKTYFWGFVEEDEEDEDVWNDDIRLGVGEYYELLQERYDKAFTVPNLDRDASYMRELAQKRHDELFPIWEEKANEVLNKILDEIERSVMNYETKTEFFWSSELWDGDKNVLNILVDKIDELGYDTATHENNLLYVSLPDEGSWDSSDD